MRGETKYNKILPMDLEKKAEILKALGQPTRLRIMEYLRNGERCVCEIFPAIGGQQSNVSRHLAVLKRAGLVLDRREGVSIFYRVKDQAIFKILNELDRKK
ncbi:MAG: metalloregulator ArsR/SmtB family transcription factor [Proteobacteria bacterium]|nr:metalloregulator ArsR/SmtB family transcription factor [Pseudomonadota bacterium]